uniref:GH16 domain-containing protein n=1 Tax=Picea sitchensis TaxID=3332 RepID=A9NQC7_PICSI|nr:unknown [Picea sitchensis]
MNLQLNICKSHKSLMALNRELALLVLAFVLVFSVSDILVSEAAGRPYSSSHGATYPITSQLSAVKFNQAFGVLWGPQHEQVSDDESGITIWLDRNSGSGFKSLRAYNSGYFSAAIKLQAGYTAGTNTAFYLSNNEVHPDYHDEIDIEFLGTIPGRPYTLQTNIYVLAGNGGSGRIVTGREQQIHLWFDPTSDFHRYSILWTPSKIVFSVDDVPIRRYPRTDAFPTRPMWVYGSIWDASSWATDSGRYKVDYNYQPFVAKYTDFVLTDCTQSMAAECS